MMLATVVVIAVLFDLVACSNVTCPYYCTRSVSYTESCGSSASGQCTRYRTEGSTCYRTGVNGEWGAWSASSVGTCTQTCGSGTRLRSYVRYCDNPAPTDCGSSCPGASTKSEYDSCNTGCCPVNGGWSTWQLQDTASCSVTCGGGTQAVTQQRVCNNPKPGCGGVMCSGNSSNVVQQSCNTQNCPVDGNWSEWGAWYDVSECSALCGGGQKTQWRERACDNHAPADGGRPCDGADTENATVVCNQEDCRDRCPENSTAFVPHANNSRLYYQCANGVALLMSCGRGTEWDQQYSTCVQDSSEQPLNDGDNNICVVDGFLPKKDDCTKFYLCAHGKPIEMSCADGLAFNAATTSCDYYNWPCREKN